MAFRRQDKKFLSEFSIQKDKPIYISDVENDFIKDNLTIPISVNEDSLGKPLNVKVTNGAISHLYLEIYGKLTNFIDIIIDKTKVLRPNHRDKIIYFDTDWKFYLLKDKFDYILAVKVLNANSIEKIRYSLNGVIINHIIDNVVGKFIERNSGEKQVTIDGDKIVSSRQNVKLKAI